MNSSTPTLTSISTGFGGGSPLVINGNGFFYGANQYLNSLTVCGAPCDVIASSFSQLTCSVPPMPSNYTLVTYNYPDSD